jgi:hypothetical protein
VDTVPVDQLLTSVYLRVVGSRMVAADVGFGYTQRLAGDLVEVIAVDEPDRVVNLDDAQVERIGEDRLRGAALENLFTEPLERHRTLPLPRGGNVHVVTGESFLVASKVLVLADVVRRLCDSPDMRYGALVGMPGRHYLMFHVIHDMNVLDAINMMTGMIARGYLRYPGPVSPYLYWWKAGTLTQLSFVEDDGSFRIEVRDTFAEVLNALAAEMG